jgi:hypothetical protein
MKYVVAGTYRLNDSAAERRVLATWVGRVLEMVATTGHDVSPIRRPRRRRPVDRRATL